MLLVLLTGCVQNQTNQQTKLEQPQKDDIEIVSMKYDTGDTYPPINYNVDYNSAKGYFIISLKFLIKSKVNSFLDIESYNNDVDTISNTISEEKRDSFRNGFKKITTENLQVGDNKLYLYIPTYDPQKDLEFNFCWYNEIHNKDNEKCTRKIFDKPKFKLEVNPTNLKFDLNKADIYNFGNYDNETLTVTNMGEFTVQFIVSLPEEKSNRPQYGTAIKQDGTIYKTALNPGESTTVKVSASARSDTNVTTGNYEDKITACALFAQDFMGGTLNFIPNCLYGVDIPVEVNVHN